MNKEEIWNSILKLLKAELSQTALDTWFSSAGLVELDGCNVVICVGNQLAKDVIGKRFECQLKRAFSDLFCQDFNIILLCGEKETKKYLEKREGLVGYRPFTCPSYSFDQYLVNDSNRFAFMVSKSVAANPGSRDHNPLFIYGPSGTGKTHLLCSIAAEINSRFPGKNIKYISGESFTNKLVKAIRNGNTEKFREEFRLTDILLIDDIQFIAGKKNTEEEFYNTFNHLYEAGKQIVMTSDVPPRDMPILGDRLRTRFEGGVIADINLPDEELRFRMIEAESRKLNLKLNRAEIEQIVSMPGGSMRQIEGILKSIYSRKSVLGASNDTAVSQVLSGTLISAGTSYDAGALISAVCSYFNISETELTGASRSRRISLARQTAMYLMRKDIGMMFGNIGELFNRDHATVVSSVSRIAKLMESNSEISDAIDEIRHKVSEKSA